MPMPPVLMNGGAGTMTVLEFCGEVISELETDIPEERVWWEEARVASNFPALANTTTVRTKAIVHDVAARKFFPVRIATSEMQGTYKSSAGNYAIAKIIM